MAVYKVIQDIEAEDKLIGPLGLKGFVYAAIALICGYIDVRLAISTELGPVRWMVMLIFAMPMFVFGTLALPIGREQPTEVWLLSRLRFRVKPRTRIWNQNNISELVTITAPKRIEHQLTKNFTQDEVQSRLRALATTIDSRGWAVKNVAVNLGSEPDYFDAVEPNSDRLVSMSSVRQPQAVIDVHASDDILDAQNNVTAQNFEGLMQKADVDRKKAIASKVKQTIKESGTARIDTEFLDHTVPPGVKETVFVSTKIVDPGQQRADSGRTEPPSGLDEQGLLDHIREIDENVRSHHPHIVPKSGAKKKKEPKPKKTETPAKTPVQSTVTEPATTAKLDLAQSDNVLPLSVASVAHLANRGPKVTNIGPNEVEIDLH